MYLAFYKLKEMPFRLAPDPRFMYWSAGHSAARACIRAAQKSRGGRAVITGERGAGKSGLIEYLRQQAPPRATLRVDCPPRTLAELTEWIHTSGEQEIAGESRIIFCDNAHLFHESMLAALLREESLPEAASSTCVVLAGEPGLADALQRPQLAALSARHCERFHLPPLSPADVTAYIDHRLSIAGANGTRIFRDAACAEIHRETKGNPRLVNALCDAAMVIACERELPEVGPAEVRRALDDIGRLVALQAEERETPAPRAPPDEQPVANGRSVFGRLRLMHGDRLVVERELPRGSLTIGRNTDNDLCIESRYISRRHCRIVTSERRCILEDVSSTNGLYVNDTRVRRHHMRDGDIVQIGEHRLHYLDLRGPTGIP